MAVEGCIIVNKMDRDFNSIIAWHIRLQRLQKGLSRKQMAEDLNCSYSAYCRMEAGEIELINPKLTQVASYFHVTIIKLLFDAVKEKISEEYHGVFTSEPHVLTDLLKTKNEMIATLEREIANLNRQIRMKDLHMARILALQRNKQNEVNL